MIRIECFGTTMEIVLDNYQVINVYNQDEEKYISPAGNNEAFDLLAEDKRLQRNLFSSC
jgi:hypothetical protein